MGYFSLGLGIPEITIIAHALWYLNLLCKVRNLTLTTSHAVGTIIISPISQVRKLRHTLNPLSAHANLCSRKAPREQVRYGPGAGTVTIPILQVRLRLREAEEHAPGHTALELHSVLLLNCTEFCIALGFNSVKSSSLTPATHPTEGDTTKVPVTRM